MYKYIFAVINPDSEEALKLADSLSEKYSKLNWKKIDNLDCNESSDVDLVVAIGGDGTILRAVSLAIMYDVPVLGINMGRVGFMTDIDGNDALQDFELYLDEKIRIEERALIEVDFKIGKDHYNYKALNDIVIARGTSTSLIETITEIDGAHLATYRGDGVVVASPTGSTGYTLALGGPVIDPNSSHYFIKPIATHMSQFGGVIINPTSICKITLSTQKDALISIDGFIEHELKNRDSVNIFISKTKAKFLRKNSMNSYWANISEKLGIKKGNQLES